MFFKLLKYWLRLVGKRKIIETVANKLQKDQAIMGKRFIFFLYETTHYQSLQLVFLARVLVSFGAECKMILCNGGPMPCELKSEYEDHSLICWGCRIGRGLLGDLDVIELEILLKNVGEGDPDQVDIKAAKDSVLRYYHGNITKASKDLTRQTKLQKYSAKLGLVAEYVDKMYSADFIVMNMTDYVYFKKFAEYFKKLGRLRTVSLTDFDHQQVVLNSYQLFPAGERYRAFKKSNGALCRSQVEKLSDFMSARLGGRNPSGSRYKYQARKDALVELLGIDVTKKNVFLFPNLHWDQGVSSSNSIFDDVVEWVGSTIEGLENARHIDLYVKPHPEEHFNKASKGFGVMEAVKQAGFSCNRVKVIGPKLNINPVDLFPYIDLGIISSGTLGLEMMYHGIRCVNVGISPYSDTPLGSSFDSVEKYTDFVREPLSDFYWPDEDEVQSFCYFYFIESLVDWPFTGRARNDEYFSVNPARCFDEVRALNFAERLMETS